MQLDVIEMDKTEARKAFLGYRRAVRERHDAEDAEIMRGYLVVGFRIDGTVAITHNSCCAPHLVSRTIDEIAKYPELQKPYGKSRESHDS